MFQKDYILRLVEQFATVMAKLMGLKEQKKFQEALELVQESLEDRFGLPSGWPEDVAPETLEKTIQAELPAQGDKWKVLADLLYEQTELFQLSGEHNRANEVAQQLVLILYQLQHGQAALPALDSVTRMENILFFLRQKNLKALTYERIVDHYRLRGQLAIAEDWLFEGMEMCPDTPLVRAAGIRFYEHILQLSNTDLEKGRLPRKEALAGLEELKG